jgi:hypothetical protein
VAPKVHDTITVSVDVEPNNPNNLDKVIIARVTVSPEGKLAMTVVKDDPAIATLTKALQEIPQKELELTAENMEGDKLVMYSFKVQPTDPHYIDAVEEELTIHYGLHAKIPENLGQ